MDGRVDPTDSFDEVIRLTKLGDDASAALLYRNYVAMVNGYARARGVSNPDDLTSEVFVGMLRTIKRFNGDESDFRRWLMTIAHRRVVDSFRRLGSSRMDFVDPVTLHNAPSIEFTELRAVAFDHNLILAFNTLTEDQREVLALRFIADISLSDVAEMTNRPIGAVKSLQHRGLTVLRQTFAATSETRRITP